MGAILVYDVTNESTFANVKIWLENLRQNGEADLIIMLVGNKTDLLEYGELERQVSTEEAQHFASLNYLMFTETSAVSSQNVREAFENLL